jgi:hypothetical protein
MKALKKENEELKEIIKDTLWMALRYADGRSTYAPRMFNMAVHKLDALGLAHLYDGERAENKRFARDGMFGEWDVSTKAFKGK